MLQFGHFAEEIILLKVILVLFIFYSTPINFDSLLSELGYLSCVRSNHCFKTQNIQLVDPEPYNQGMNSFRLRKK